MNIKSKIIKAAQQCLDEKWYPMSKAKTVEEIMYIEESTICALCDLTDNDCDTCPMDTGDDCSKGYDAWNLSDDFKTQHLQIMVVVAELKAIVKGG